MFGISPFIFILLPLLFQLFYGEKAIHKTISKSFGTITFISLISQIIFSVIAFYIASYNFTKSLEGRPYRCGMGILPIVAFAFLFTIILLIVIIVQYFIKKSHDKKSNN
ncbi:hypothetical protein ASE21_10360 [Flavobacterium sp. Root901]|nr:hypothetical protein ASE21_10360 [Flavobacterium sp. Root901]